MNEKHLSDDQLQDYLDGNATTADFFKTHIESCSRCREALAAYQSLYEMLKEETPVFLPENFADRIMPQLPDGTSRRFAFDRLISVVFIGTIAATAFYFLALSEWLRGIPIWSGLLDTAGSRGSVISHSSITLLNFDPLLLLSVVLTLISIGLIDHMVAKRRHHHSAILLV